MNGLPRSAAFVNAAEIAVCTGPARASRGRRPAAILRGAAVAVVNGIVEALGPQEDVLAEHPHLERVNCAGRVLTPGSWSYTHADEPQMQKPRTRPSAASCLPPYAAHGGTARWHK
ncbi:MAG TPA: hypothetical protein VHG93_26385 [Longimicrobium sp.]|nr:hypothetical protein [Longimicrobium sp.]